MARFCCQCPEGAQVAAAGRVDFDALTYPSVLTQSQDIGELQDFGSFDEGDLSADQDELLIDGRRLAVLDSEGFLSPSDGFRDRDERRADQQATRRLTLLNFGSEDVAVRSIRVSQVTTNSPSSILFNDPPGNARCGCDLRSAV
jgi:hypothetical protein